MRTVETIADARAALAPLRSGTIGLVPTMCALHEGHLALVAAARKECDTVVASIFFNPAQFGPGEDIGRYPRDLEHDAKAAEAAGVDVLFTPSPEELYPPGFSTWVEVEELSHVLEGAYRPGHFRGVATVCLKLFAIVRPGRVYFGRKDAQQVAVIRRLIRDLDLEVELRAVETVRDADGLALSSRNRNLSADERLAAVAIPRALAAGAAAYRTGADAAAAARAALAEEPLVKTQYVEVARFEGDLVLAAAARVGATRLIDNVSLADG
ncbi:MAG: pantoate--beta-alanine ligase [Gaiellaceae bacterium]